MAKAPSAKVSKTSGQGVSRLSYQTGYRLGNRGTASPGGGVKDAPSSARSDYGKSSGGKAKFEKTGDLNISYGDTIFPTDLKDIEGAHRGKPSSPGFLKLGKKMGLKERKSDAGFLKGKK
jgi:hypothetical protein